MFIFTLLAAATLPGCAGNGNGLDSNGNPVSSGGGNGSIPLTPDFESIQVNVFSAICTKCHIGAGAPEGLQLDPDHSYALLVGTPSTEQPSVLRVAPNDPDSSYIIRKLQDSAGISGQQMPLGGPYLPQATIDVIRQWISAGAPKAAAAQSLEAALRSVQRFSVASTSPDDLSTVSTPVSQIVVSFNADIDSTMINNTTVTVDSLPPDQDPLPVLVTTAMPVGNSSAVLIKPRSALPNGTYRVTLHGSLANLDAQALGSDISFTFTVETLQ